MASSMQDQAKLPAEVVLLENLLVGHVENHLEIHEQCIEELRLAAKEDLTPHRTLVKHASILRIGNLDGQRPVSTR